MKTLGTSSEVKDAEIKKIKLVLKTSDQITVLSVNGDCILFEKSRDKDNPYLLIFFDGMFELQGKVRALPSPRHSAIIKTLKKDRERRSEERLLERERIDDIEELRK